MNHSLADAVAELPRYQRSRHRARHTDSYLYNQLIPYLGNKRKLLGLIGQALARTVSLRRDRPTVFADLFAGSGVVGRMARRLGFRVIANDWEPYAEQINRCFIACERLPSFERLGGIEAVFGHLNDLPPVEGYFATYYAPRDDEHPDPETERMFFTHANAARLDAMRTQIGRWQHEELLDDDELAVLLAPLVYSVSYVSNTSGVFKGFHRGWGGAGQVALYRILSTLHLTVPVLCPGGPGGHRVTRQDATELAAGLGPVDVAYIDPPYNQHPYGSNYHLLNSVVLDDQPPLQRSIIQDGKTVNKSAIRADWRTARRSRYNCRREAAEALAELLEVVGAEVVLISYSRDGFIDYDRMMEILCPHGRVTACHQRYKRYRVSPTRPSPRSHTCETVFALQRGGRAGRVEDVWVD